MLTFGVLMAMGAKLAVGITGAAGVAKGVNWFTKKSFNSSTSKKVGVLNDRFKHDSEES